MTQELAEKEIGTVSEKLTIAINPQNKKENAKIVFIKT